MAHRQNAHGIHDTRPPGRDAFVLGLVRAMGLGLAQVELLRDAAGRAVDHRFLDLDEAFERALGVSAAHAEGRSLREIAPESADLWTAQFDRIARAGRPERVVAQAPLRGRWFEVLAHPHDPDHLTVLFSDVTDRRRVEERLRASEGQQVFMLRLSDALRLLDDPDEIQRAAAREIGEHLGVARAFYFRVERDAGGGLVHVVEHDHHARPGLPTYVGRYAQAAYGRPFLTGLDRGETLSCPDITAIPGLTAGERAAYAAAGARSFVLVPVLHRGQYIGGLSVLDDVARRWTRAQLEAIEQTVERTRAAVERGRGEARQRDFVANAAHDLRTPLTGITTALDALEAGAKDHPADRDLFLAHLRRETDRMTRLCESLLLLTKADEAREVPRRRLAVRGVLDHVAADLRPRPGVRVEVDASPAATVVSNAGLLERVVANLADNAVKYTPAGRVVLHASRDRGVVTIEVRDTGTGIRPEIAGRVFDRFFRGGDRSRDGFGLGLAIAARAASALGGTLTLARAPEGGTIARLTIADDVA